MAIVRGSGPEVGEHRDAAGERGAHEPLHVARSGERQPVGDGLADDVGGERGAQAGGDEALLGRVGDGGRSAAARIGRGRDVEAAGGILRHLGLGLGLDAATGR